ncbi:hypothetical protein DFJ74DRAFT_680375 [Hyaloraphidium curvatum]|nr:hypothetical protein DFJ74DRAFT_680375 [Hyaloraphidium curvatum]
MVVPAAVDARFPRPNQPVPFAELAVSRELDRRGRELYLESYDMNNYGHRSTYLQRWPPRVDLDDYHLGCTVPVQLPSFASLSAWSQEGRWDTELYWKAIQNAVRVDACSPNALAVIPRGPKGTPLSGPAFLLPDPSPERVDERPEPEPEPIAAAEAPAAEPPKDLDGDVPMVAEAPEGGFVEEQAAVDVEAAAEEEVEAQEMELEVQEVELEVQLEVVEVEAEEVTVEEVEAEEVKAADPQPQPEEWHYSPLPEVEELPAVEPVAEDLGASPISDSHPLRADVPQAPDPEVKPRMWYRKLFDRLKLGRRGSR